MPNPTEPDTPGGVLYVIATPIGNLGDITYRAAKLLGEVDRVLAEDTRHSGRLLQHLGHKVKMLSLNEHNERRRIELVLRFLREGQRIALISDAGTPAISDPGFPLVRAAREAGLKVVPIPGPSALITAACAAGLATDRLYFLGFLPGRPGRRKKILASALDQPTTVVLYISPYKLQGMLDLLVELVGPDRDACLCRELTKIHEQFDRGTLGDLQERWAERKVKGELCLLIARAED